MSKSGKVEVRKLSVALLSVLALAVALLLIVGVERQPQAVHTPEPTPAEMSAESNHIIVVGKRLPAELETEEPVASVVITAKRERVAQVMGSGRKAR